jgi:hypothetical protein
LANNLKQYDANQVLRSVYELGTNSLRVSVVDGTTGGGPGFEVIITHTSDSIRLGDGTNYFTSTTVGPKIGLDVAVINDISSIITDSDGDELEINPDGSINVNIGSATSSDPVNKYGEVSAVASAMETTLVSHTAAIGKTTYLQGASSSGQNIADYKVKVNGTVIDRKLTNFGANPNVDFFFDGYLNLGYLLNVGDIVTVTVIHSRPYTADFNGKLKLIEVT